MSELGKEIIDGLTDAIQFMEGNTKGAKVHQVELDAVDVKAIRTRLGLTQDQMAALLGTSVSGFRKWEQGARQPSGAARTLLKVMDREPQSVLRALEAV